MLTICDCVLIVYFTLSAIRTYHVPCGFRLFLCDWLSLCAHYDNYQCMQYAPVHIMLSVCVNMAIVYVYTTVCVSARFSCPALSDTLSLPLSLSHTQPGRTYILEDTQGYALEWVKAIEEVRVHTYGGD